MPVGFLQRRGVIHPSVQPFLPNGMGLLAHHPICAHITREAETTCSFSSAGSVCFATQQTMTAPARLQNDELGFANFSNAHVFHESDEPAKTRTRLASSSDLMFSPHDRRRHQTPATDEDASWASQQVDSDDDEDTAALVFRKNALGSFITPPKCKITTDDVDWFSEAESDFEDTASKKDETKKKKKHRKSKKTKDKSKSSKDKKEKSKSSDDKKDKKEKKKKRKEKKEKAKKKKDDSSADTSETTKDSKGSGVKITEDAEKSQRSKRPSDEESPIRQTTVVSDVGEKPDVQDTGNDFIFNSEVFRTDVSTLAKDNTEVSLHGTRKNALQDILTDEPVSPVSDCSPPREDITAEPKTPRRSQTPSRRGRRSIEKFFSAKSSPGSNGVEESPQEGHSISSGDSSRPHGNSISSIVSDILAANAAESTTLSVAEDNTPKNNSLEALPKESLIERAKEEARKHMLDQSRRGPLRVRVTLRKKSGSSETPNRSRRGSRSSVKVPLSSCDFEGLAAAAAAATAASHDSFSSIGNHSPGRSERSLRKLENTSADSPTASVRGGRQVGNGGYNPNNTDMICWSSKPNAEQAPLGRNVLHREDRLRTEKEIGGVVEQVIRSRREHSLDVGLSEDSCPSKPARSASRGKTPVRNRSYSNLLHFDSSEKQMLFAVRPQEAEPEGRGNLVRRKSFSKLLLGGSSHHREHGAPRRSKSHGFRPLG